MGNGLTGVGLSQAPLDLRKENEALYGILVGGVRGERPDRLKDLLLGRHAVRIPAVSRDFNGRPYVSITLG
mgnify:FL=1